MRPNLVPGYNVDKVDIAAGCKFAATIGYNDGVAQMVTEYALMRHARGEEDGAQSTWLSEYPSDLTSWYMILAHARATAETETTTEE